MIEATTRPPLEDDALIFGDCHIATRSDQKPLPSLPGQSKNASRPHNQLPNAYFRTLLALRLFLAKCRGCLQGGKRAATGLVVLDDAVGVGFTKAHSRSSKLRRCRRPWPMD